MPRPTADAEPNDFQESVEVAIRRHRENGGWSPADMAAARDHFARAGLVIVTPFFPQSVIDCIAEETTALLDGHAMRRDFRMGATGNTRRNMRNIRHAEIRQHGRFIPALYDSVQIREILTEIAAEPLFTCPFEEERYVVTCLERKGDTHGWHWDDYSFALVWVIETPPPESGGFVQCVPHTIWDKADPKLGAVLARNMIHSHPVGSGQLYLLRSDTTLHRVYPLVESGRRVIVNMAWASGRDLGRKISHETMDALWSARPDRRASSR